MGQQVADHQLRVGRVAADDHVDGLTGGGDDGAMQLQGDGRPLVLLDAAVVVRLEEGELVVLIERQLLEVQPGGIHVGGGEGHALGHGLFAHDGQHQRLAAVGAVNLVAGLELHAGHELNKALLLRQLYGVAHALALRARIVEEALVVLAVGVHGLAAGGAHGLIAVFGLIEELGAVIFLFFHVL